MLITRCEGENIKLFADGLFISTFTVGSHRKNLLLKINDKNSATLVKIVVSKGVVDVD